MWFLSETCHAGSNLTITPTCKSFWAGEVQRGPPPPPPPPPSPQAAVTEVSASRYTLDVFPAGASLPPLLTTRYLQTQQDAHK